MKRWSISAEDRREIRGMALPILVEQFAIAAMGSLVSMMVKSSGLAAVAAVNLLNSLIQLFQTTYVAIGSGATVVVAQSRAKNDPAHTGHIASQAVMMGILTSAVLAAACFVFREKVLSLLLGQAEADVYAYARIYLAYNLVSLPFIAAYQVATATLRGAGAPRVSLYATLVNNGSYALLGLLAIGPFHAGLTGVSVALLLSRAIAGLYACLLLRRGTSCLRMQRLFTLTMDRAVLRPMLRITTPICLQNLLFQGGKLITQRFSVAFGTAGIAANGICNTLAPLVETPGSTCAQSVTPVVAYRYGRGEKEQARQMTRAFIVLDVVTCLAAAGLMAAVLGPLARFYSTEAAVQHEITRVMLLCCAVTPVAHGLSWALPAAMNGTGDVKFTSFITILSMFLMRITVGYVLAVVLKIGVIGIWIAMYADWFFRALCFILRFRSGKWLDHERL